MTGRSPIRLCQVRPAWILFVVSILAVPIARAQHHAAAAPRPIYRTYQRPMMARPVVRPPLRTMMARPMPARPMMYQRAMPARRPVLRSLPRSSAVRAYVAPRTFARRLFVPYSSARMGLPASDFHAGIRSRGAWIGPLGYFDSFLFGWPLNAYGYWPSPSNYPMLPLGFGMWPACDSASMPGSFATVGPCFGMGDYQSLEPNYQNQLLAESAPEYYQPPLELFVQPQPTPSSAKAQPTQPQKKPNMVVCLTNGQQTEVSDWWVTRGRFYFIPISGPLSGKTQTVDLNTLDLQKTIETDESRGRTFILNFTPPNERPKPGVNR
jgi:hypothetical protein